MMRSCSGTSSSLSSGSWARSRTSQASTRASTRTHIRAASPADRQLRGSAALGSRVVSDREIRTVGVVGLGAMGSGIAQLAIEAGYDVVGREVTIELGEKARERIAHFL